MAGMNESFALTHGVTRMILSHSWCHNWNMWQHAANNARGLTNVFNKKSLKIPKGNQNPHIEEQKMEIMV